MADYGGSMTVRMGPLLGAAISLAITVLLAIAMGGGDPAYGRSGGSGAEVSESQPAQFIEPSIAAQWPY